MHYCLGCENSWGEGYPRFPPIWTPGNLILVWYLRAKLKLGQKGKHRLGDIPPFPSLVQHHVNTVWVQSVIGNLQHPISPITLSLSYFLCMPAMTKILPLTYHVRDAGCTGSSAVSEKESGGTLLAVYLHARRHSSAITTSMLVTDTVGQNTLDILAPS